MSTAGFTRIVDFNTRILNYEVDLVSTQLFAIFYSDLDSLVCSKTSSLNRDLKWSWVYFICGPFLNF